MLAAVLVPFVVDHIGLIVSNVSLVTLLVRACACVCACAVSIRVRSPHHWVCCLACCGFVIDVRLPHFIHRCLLFCVCVARVRVPIVWLDKVCIDQQHVMLSHYATILIARA